MTVSAMSVCVTYVHARARVRAYVLHACVRVCPYIIYTID